MTIKRNPLANAVHVGVERIAHQEMRDMQLEHVERTKRMVRLIGSRLNGGNWLTRLWWRLRYTDRAISWWGLPQ